MRALLAKPGYLQTKYQGGAATFDADQRALDLRAAPKDVAAVKRATQTVVSDTGIFYQEAAHRTTALGHYVLSDSGSGQADIKGFGQVEYDLRTGTGRIQNARLPINNGQMWFLTVDRGALVTDSAPGKAMSEYGRGGTLTSCDDSIPDYHFVFKDVKHTSANTIVARSLLLYIKDVPVVWLPFMFTDARVGRHSGILTPRFGVGDIVRNSASYRRNVENVGYYWVLSDYMDAATWLDWRSSSGGDNNSLDPGWLRLNGEWQYRWLDRFLSGRLGTAYTSQRDGSNNLALSWAHQQEFSRNSHLTTNLNYVKNTTLQRQNTFNPYAALATISSSLNYQQKIGPASLSLGGTRKQYPGREQVDQTLPTLSLTTGPVRLANWLTWTPNFNYTTSQTTHMDQPGVVTYRYVTNASGARDSVKIARSSYTSQLSFDTPIQIFGYNIRNAFRINQQRNDFPEQKVIYDVETGAQQTRIYASTFRSDIDWTPDFQIPPLLGHNKFNLTPTIALANVDPGPFWVKTERTNGEYVHQSKRLSFGLSAAPTIYGLFPGFGPFARLRHSVSPTVGYTYAPRADVSDAYLNAIGATRQGYRGGLQQNAVSFGLSTAVDSKFKVKSDSTGTQTSPSQKLVSIQFTPLAYDFEVAHHAGGAIARLTTQTWGYSLHSDFLPGLQFSTNYSLFQGSTLSDTAVFKPYRENVSASLNISQTENPFAVFARLFGKAVPEAQKSPTPTTDQVRPRPDDALARQVAALPVAGSGSRGERFLLPQTQGWRASFTFSSSRPRPPTGNNVLDFDPRQRCEQLSGGNSFIFNTCLEQLRVAPTTDTPVQSTTLGGQAYRIPATTSLNGNMNFNLTPKWAVGWQTTYDLERHEFASHIVQLQRDIHDWRATFAFTQSPNGNFAFNFSIALKAEPDLKFDYNRATVRSGISPF